MENVSGLEEVHYAGSTSISEADASQVVLLMTGKVFLWLLGKTTTKFCRFCSDHPSSSV